MKNIALLLIILLIFFACAALGFQIANRSDLGPPAGQIEGTVNVGNGGEQHNLVFVQVDQLDGHGPALKSVWFVSLFYMEGNPPTVTFAQIYPSKTQSPITNSIRKSFALDAKGEPSKAFWQAVSALKIKWEGYLLIDNLTMLRFLEWVNGPGNFGPVLDDVSAYPAESKQIIEQTCRLVSGLDNRKTEDFVWGDLVPAHFRTNLRMETALAYWKRVTSSAVAARCEVVLAP